MKYLSESDIKEIGVDWNRTISVIEQSVEELRTGNYAQPLKPYLRYKSLKNRIIAMPAYVGGEYGSAGIKWIASFPDNIKKNQKRANAVVILNEVDTGKPYCVINTGLISAIRTASVSGLMLKKYYENYSDQSKSFNIGIIGFGPIGQLHMDLCFNFDRNKVDKVFLYDKKGLQLSDIPENYRDRVVIVDDWETLIKQSDIAITCTVSSDRYIDKYAKKGTLHLNVSLRDYCPEFMQTVDLVIVDDWDEVCRENTDIELMYLKHNLNKNDVYNIYDQFDDKLTKLENKIIMFNPMGMAVFDIAISHFYFTESRRKDIGVLLPE